MKTVQLTTLLAFSLGTLLFTPVQADFKSDKYASPEQHQQQRRDEGKARHTEKKQKQSEQARQKRPPVENQKNLNPGQRKHEARDNRQPDQQHYRQDKRYTTHRYDDQKKSHNERYPEREQYQRDYRKKRHADRRYDYTDHYRDNRRYEVRHGNRLILSTPRHRTYRNVYIVRPFGHSYFGYGHFLNDHNALRWLGFTAITLKLLDMVDEQAQREHEAAQIMATTADVGERIYWDTDDASGYVMTTRRGTSSRGLQCREYQHSITVGGETEEAYGSACLQPDGSWKIVK